MQTLFVKEKGPDGKDREREVRVNYIWGDVRLGLLFLHENGTYGYKNGEPVKSREELSSIITDPIQKEYALMWWDNVGKKLSEEHYRRKTDETKARLGAMFMGSMGDSGRLDMIQYQRRPVSNRAEKAYSDPSTWSSWYQARPDWWGHAKTIELGEWYYRRMDPGDTRGDSRTEEPDEARKAA